MPYKKKKCLDCDRFCCGVSLRCKICSNKLKGLIKEQKGLRKKYFCIICNAELTKSKYKRCHACNMLVRWSDIKYKESTIKSMQESFDLRWKSEGFRRKVIKILTTHNGVSKLEKSVGDIALKYGFTPSVAIDRYLADFCHKDYKVIIEINGDFWHCNPVFWQPEDDHPFKKLKAKQIWAKDLARSKFLESLGYKVCILWERDILKGKSQFLEKIFQQLILDGRNGCIT